MIDRLIWWCEHHFRLGTIECYFGVISLTAGLLFVVVVATDGVEIAPCVAVLFSFRV